MMGIIMRNDVLLVIKDTLEDVQNITVLSMNVVDNTVFGIYVREVKESLSFLNFPKNHFETTIDNINIHFFELGTVLHSIYYNGALNFLDILYSNVDIIEDDSYYIDLCDLIFENVPFNIAKLKYIETYNEYFDNGVNTEPLSMLMDVANNLNVSLLSWNNKCMDNFYYIKKIETENDVIKACNSLNDFKIWLEGENFSKISERNMNKIDQMYINLQISHMEA